MDSKLSVNPKELKDAFKKIKLSDRKLAVGEVAFSFKDGFLELQTQGVSVQIPASGTWTGRVRVNVHNLRPMIQFPPKDNPLIIRYENNRLLFGSYSIPVQLEDISPPPTLIPMDLTWIELLRLKLEYPEATLISSGIKPKIEKAEEKLVSKVLKAADILKETGVSGKELMDLVRHKLLKNG